MQVLAKIDEAQVKDLLGRDEFFWLDLAAPDEKDINRLGALLSLHPMVLEDMREFGQRPKLDDYGDWVLLVFYGARSDAEGRAELIEVECIISGRFIVTVHRDSCDEFDALRESLARRQPEHEQILIYRVLDTLTDTFFPVLAAIDNEIDDLENDVIEQPSDAQLQRLFQLKRDLVLMRKVITPQRDLFARAGDDIIALPGLEEASRDYFRDVYDHLIRISDLIDSYRDLLTGAMDVYLSTISNRLNAVMKQLTVIATIFLPLTFITGFFGQNFAYLVKHINTGSDFLYFGVGGVVVPIIALIVYFRRSGFI